MPVLDNIPRQEPVVLLQARVPQSVRRFANSQAAAEGLKLGEYLIGLLRAKGYKPPERKANKAA